MESVPPQVIQNWKRDTSSGAGSGIEIMLIGRSLSGGDAMREFWLDRFTQSNLSGHVFGDLFAALELGVWVKLQS